MSTNYRKPLVVFILLIIGISTLLFLRRERRPPQTEATLPAETNRPGNLVNRPAGRDDVAVPRPGEPQYLQYYQEQSRLDPQFDWKRPINFYGRVVDEDGQPVVGATADLVWNDISDTGTSKAQVASDASGFFSLLDRKGKRLYIKIEKAGYYSPKDSNVAFEYANPHGPLFVPDANNPVIFRLRKKGKGEPLVCGQHLWGFKADGTQYYLDLVSGKKFTERPQAWDLSVRFVRSATNEQRRFDWSLVLEANDGGLIETNAEFMFLAPESGYQPFKLDKLAEDQDWKAHWNHKLYLKSRAGKNFARIECDIIPKYSENAAIDMSYCVNPNSSRNLEFDPAVQPKQTQFE